MAADAMRRRFTHAGRTYLDPQWKQNMTTPLDGYKTYIVMAAIILLAIADAIPALNFDVPEWLYLTLAGFGGLTLAQKINRATKDTP